MNATSAKLDQEKLREEKVGLYTVTLYRTFSNFKRKYQFVVFVPKPRGWRNSTAKVYCPFDDLNSAEVYFAKTVNYFDKSENTKAARRRQQFEERQQKAAAGAEAIKVGDIFHRSWGYDMTINDFYQVVVKRNKTLMVAKLRSEVTKGSGGYSGEEKPVPLNELDPNMPGLLKAVVIGKDAISVKGDHAYLVTSDRSWYFNNMD